MHDGVPLFRQESAELWVGENVRCVLVPKGQHVEVQLRNTDGSAFLRKTAPSRQAALNEAEYLRLLLLAAHRPAAKRGLKPFALVIEDDKDNCEALSEALRLSGMRTLGCPRGTEGVSLARELAPDLIVIDYRLPDITGAEVCRRLRSDPETASAPIIAVTASPEALRAEGCEADAVLTKPCQLDTLIAAARLFVRDLAFDVDAQWA
jgi:CheY-like chemotaxis protein